MLARIRKNDVVMVISGKDKGKQGSVIAILPKKGKVIVQGVAVVTRHVKARRQGETPGIKREESYIPIAKVMPVCSSCRRPSRVGVKALEHGKTARICNRCKEIL